MKVTITIEHGDEKCERSFEGLTLGDVLKQAVVSLRYMRGQDHINRLPMSVGYWASRRWKGGEQIKDKPDDVQVAVAPASDNAATMSLPAQSASPFAPVRSGSWSVRSESDPRWNGGGRANVGGFVKPAEVDAYVKQRTAELGAPPADLKWSYMKD
jgi:hypothetical protein